MVNNPKKQIIVVDYNPKWRIEFQKLKKMYEDVIGDHIISIEHIGSTSVEGLAAKPILDIVIVIELDNFNMVKDGLSTLGYFHNGDQGIKGREAFKLPDEIRSKCYRHHLYVCDKDADELHRFQAFVSYLRKYPEIKNEYGKIKKQGANICNNDIEIYMDHKGPFVTKHLAKAMYEADVVPKPNFLLCVSCGSNNVEYDFFISYEGSGYKKELFKFSCNNCNIVFENSVN